VLTKAQQFYCLEILIITANFDSFYTASAGRMLLLIGFITHILHDLKDDILILDTFLSTFLAIFILFILSE